MTAHTLKFQAPEKNERHGSVHSLAKALRASYNILYSLSKIGVIEPYRGEYHTDDCAARLKEYCRQMAIIKRKVGPNGSQLAHLDLGLINEAGTIKRKNAPPRGTSPFAEGDTATTHQAIIAERDAGADKRRRRKRNISLEDDDDIVQYSDEAVMEMIKNHDPQGKPSEDPVTRRQRLDADKIALMIAQKRALLVERAKVLEQISKVSEAVSKNLGDFFREIDATYSTIEDPEERIEWGQEQLRLRIEIVLNAFRKVGVVNSEDSDD